MGHRACRRVCDAACLSSIYELCLCFLPPRLVFPQVTLRRGRHSTVRIQGIRAVTDVVLSQDATTHKAQQTAPWFGRIAAPPQPSLSAMTPTARRASIASMLSTSSAAAPFAWMKRVGRRPSALVPPTSPQPTISVTRSYVPATARSPAGGGGSGSSAGSGAGSGAGTGGVGGSGSGTGTGTGAGAGSSAGAGAGSVAAPLHRLSPKQRVGGAKVKKTQHKLPHDTKARALAVPPSSPSPSASSALEEVNAPPHHALLRKLAPQLLPNTPPLLQYLGGGVHAVKLAMVAASLPEAPVIVPTQCVCTNGHTGFTRRCYCCCCLLFVVCCLLFAVSSCVSLLVRCVLFDRHLAASSGACWKRSFVCCDPAIKTRLSTGTRTSSLSQACMMHARG